MRARGAVFGEGGFEAGDGFDLAVAHAIGGKRVGRGHGLRRARRVSGSALQGRGSPGGERRRRGGAGVGSRSSRKLVSTPVDS